MLFAEGLPLRPNPGPEELPPETSWMPLILAVAAIGAILVVTWAMRRWWRRRRTAPRPAHEIALAELDRIAGMKVVDMAGADRFYVLITDVLRRYVGTRFEIDAIGRTTRELTHILQGVNHILTEKKALLTELLTRADLVKFARDLPQTAETDSYLQQVRQFIRDTAG
jgi:hypothetical protein